MDEDNKVRGLASDHLVIDEVMDFETPSVEPSVAAKRPGTLAEKFAEKKAKKRQQRLQEITEILLKNGQDPNQANAILAREEYEKLPIDERLKRLEATVARGFAGFAGETQALRHNDHELALAMDINFKAIGIALKECGIDEEKQMEIIKTAHRLIQEDDANRRAAEAEARRAADDANKEIEKKDVIVSNIDVPGEPENPATAGDATVFGG